MIVVDASVAVKWVAWEADSDQALQFLAIHGPELCAPDIILLEVAGAIVRLANMREWTKADAEEALLAWTGDWGAAAVDARRIRPDLVRRAGLLATEIGHPIADCLYLALAIELSCPLVTCDLKFRERAISLHQDILTLAELDLPPSQ